MLNKKSLIVGALGLGCLLALQVGPAMAQEVNKGKIPEAQLETSYKTLEWGAEIWDTAEAVGHLKKGDNLLWVDTRPASFFNKGTVRGAVHLIYNKAGMEENTLNADSLAAAITEAGMSKESAKIAFFCQGPKCHRSYNASFAAITEWGYKADNIIWFRSGYPYLLKEVKDNAKLKRKAKKYISDAGLKEL